MEGKLPTFLIIGAMKAGTTSFHHHLSQHPEIFMSKQKELDFFLTSKNFSKGVDWYKSNFITDKKVRGEASPNYSKWNVTPELIYNLIPNVKLVYILRDPIKRFLSEMEHLQMNPNEYIKERQGGEAMTNGLYAKHIQNYLHFFDRSQIKIIDFESFRKDPDSTMEDLFDFLHVDPANFDYSILKTKQHITKEKPLPGTISKKAAKSNSFVILKSLIRHNEALYNQLKKTYHQLFYSKRESYTITDDNILLLKEYYEDDVNYLRKEEALALKDWSV